jgi:hypothetical protein
MTPIFTGKIDRGKVILDSPARYIVQLSKLEGKRIELVIRKQKSKRSNDQNSAYWGIVIDILSECEAFGGYTKDEIHDALREKFLSVVDPKTGIKKIRSTTDLSTIEFNDYYANIQRWAAEFLNCYIPDPNEIPLMNAV